MNCWIEIQVNDVTSKRKFYCRESLISYYHAIVYSEKDSEIITKFGYGTNGCKITPEGEEHFNNILKEIFPNINVSFKDMVFTIPGKVNPCILSYLIFMHKYGHKYINEKLPLWDISYKLMFTAHSYANPLGVSSTLNTVLFPYGIKTGVVSTQFIKDKFSSGPSNYMLYHDKTSITGREFFNGHLEEINKLYNYFIRKFGYCIPDLAILKSCMEGKHVL
jgi:hypothetical protein